MEGAFRAIDQVVAGDRNGELLAARARGLMIGYHARWADGGWSPEAIGPAFQASIRNPATGRSSRTFSGAGRCDGMVARDGRHYLLVWKMASDEIHAADAPFWERLAVDNRSGMSGILALGRSESNGPVEGVLFDTVRRPQIRPRVIPKGSASRSDAENLGTQEEIGRRGSYFGWPVDSAGCRGSCASSGRETYGLFSLRVAAETCGRPEHYFQRRVVERGPIEWHRERQELWESAVEIRLSQRAGRHCRNSSACMHFNTPCPYLPICSGREVLESGGWRHLESIHPELAGELGGVDERSVLTPHRIEVFKLCRRKHHFRYELGVVPVEPPEGDALRLARVVRRALAAWWAGEGEDR